MSMCYNHRKISISKALGLPPHMDDKLYTKICNQEMSVGRVTILVIGNAILVDR
jgi:hypothetical protein